MNSSRFLHFPLVAALFFAFNILCMPNEFIPSDPIAMRAEARSLVDSGTLEIDPSFAKSIGTPGQFFVASADGARYYSKWGVANSLPYLLPMAAEKIFTGRLPVEDTRTRLFLFNVLQAFLAALLFYFVCELAYLYCADRALSVLYAVLSLYCSFLWYYLRAQSTEILHLLLFTACACFYLRNLASRSRAHMLLFAASLYFLCLTRVVFLLVIPSLFCFELFFRFPKNRAGLFKRFALLTIPLLLLIGLQNQLKFGSPFYTGYLEANAWNHQNHLPRISSVWNYWGALFSPRWGIVLNFPVFLFAIFAFWRRRANLSHTHIALLFLSVPIFAFICSLPVWRGEFSYGPRYLTCFLPVLCLPAIDVFKTLSRSGRSTAEKAVAFAAIILFAQSALWQLSVLRAPFYSDYGFLRAFRPYPPFQIVRGLEEQPLGATLNEIRSFERDAQDAPGITSALAEVGWKEQDVENFRSGLTGMLGKNNFFFFP